MIARFNIVSPPAKRRSFTVRLPILVGRGDEAKFRIQHDLISRKHCEFFHRDGVVYVRDLGSTNGTFLNEEQIPLSTKTRVPSGATVRVGGLSFTVDYHLEATGQPAAENADDRAARQTDVTVGVPHADHDAGPGASDLLAVEHVAGEDAGHHGAEPAAAADADEPVDFMDAAHAESPAEPQAEVEQEAAADLTEKVANEQEAAVPDEPAADQPAVLPPLEPLAAPPAAGFDFLAAEQPPAEPAADAEWPSPAEDAAAEAPDDDDLNNFFKGLK